MDNIITELYTLLDKGLWISFEDISKLKDFIINDKQHLVQLELIDIDHSSINIKAYNKAL